MTPSSALYGHLHLPVRCELGEGVWERREERLVTCSSPFSRAYLAGGGALVLFSPPPTPTPTGTCFCQVLPEQVLPIHAHTVHEAATVYHIPRLKWLLGSKESACHFLTQSFLTGRRIYTVCSLSQFSVLSWSAFRRYNKIPKSWSFTKRRGSDRSVVVEAGKFSTTGSTSASAQLPARAFLLQQQWGVVGSVAGWWHSKHTG